MNRLSAIGRSTRQWLGFLALLIAATSALRAEQSTEAFLAGLDRSPLVIETAANGARKFEVWLVRTPAERARGLMHVESLEDNSGMLFVYPSPQFVGMWMKNTLIPLDMIFIEADGRIVFIAENTVPHSLESISAGQPVTAVLELRGGRTAELGIAVGDTVRHAAFSPLRRGGGN